MTLLDKRNKIRDRKKEKIINEVNILGIEACPKFYCINYNAKPESKYIYVKIATEKLKKTKIIRLDHIRRKRNPFNWKKEGEELKNEIKKIKEIAQKGKFKIIDIFMNKKREKSGVIRHIKMIKCRCLVSGEEKNRRYDGILGGKHPFNLQMKEVNEIQPKYEKMFKKLGFKVYKEVKLKNKRIDFVIVKNKNILGIEVKRSSRVHWGEKKLKPQIDNYLKLGREHYGSSFNVVLSDPEGVLEDSISYNNLRMFLKDL